MRIGRAHFGGSVPFVFNEGGRGFTLSVYRRPFAVRVYLVGRVWIWGR